MWKPGSQSKSSSSAEVDFLQLCTDNVRTIEDLVNGWNLLNQRQCLDLSSKLSRTTLNIRDLVLGCGGASADLFRPGLESLYRYLEEAKLLVSNCGAKEWWAAAVIQSQNENAFREVLLDIGFCYNAIYEQYKSLKQDSDDLAEDLRQLDLCPFRPATDGKILEDKQDLQKRLQNLLNERISTNLLVFFRSGKRAAEQLLAEYLAAKMKYSSEQSEANSLDACTPILWAKDSEPSGTWGDYKLIGAGSGASGVCSTTWMGLQCAKKEFHANGVEKFFLKEAGILAHLKHPCIVNFFCCGNGQGKGDRFIAMELMQKSLSDLIDDQKGVHFSLPVVVDMMVQIARGVWYLHEQGVAHRDLKPQNVVVTKLTSAHLLPEYYCVKLVDFGMAMTKVEVSKSNSISARGVGTTRYRAPEVHPQAYSNSKAKATWVKADVFSFAMTCAHILSLKTPFGEMTPSEVYSKLKEGRSAELPSDCPQELSDLLRDCWDTSPSSRPSFAQVCKRLETFRHKMLRGCYPPHEGSQEGRLDFGSGFDFIRMKLEEHSFSERQLVNIDDEVEVETNVSSISCTCGRALQSPYIDGKFCCSICGEDGYGKVYHCETCEFDAHPECAEIKDEVKVFFHSDVLHLLVRNYSSDDPDAICGFCEESVQDSEWVYRCEHCDFNVHALCTKYSRTLEHSSHSHDLTLVKFPRHKNVLCKSCSGNVIGHCYTCTRRSCAFDLHPFCASLPMTPLCIFDRSHRLYLDSRQKGFQCGRCGALGFSWSYHCEHCEVDIHLDCVEDVEADEDDRNRAYERFILESGTTDGHTKTVMITDLLDRLLVSDASEGSFSSSSRPPPGTMKVQSTIQRLTSTERPNLEAFGDENFCRKIVAENEERKAKKVKAAKEARQKLKAKFLEMLENLEESILDLQSSTSMSQADGEGLLAKHSKLKKREYILQEEKTMQEQSKKCQGPRISLLSNWADSVNSYKLLTSLGADMDDVGLKLLCEEPGHEHVDGAYSGWAIGSGVQWEKLQPLVARGLLVVLKAMRPLTAQPTELDSVILPNLGNEPWDLRAIDLVKHCEQSRKPCEDEENVEALKRAEDSAAVWLLSYLEGNGCNIFDSFGLVRGRYTETDEGNSPRYTRGTLAWLCTDHLNDGIKAGTLEPYPLKYYNFKYDKKCGVL